MLVNNIKLGTPATAVNREVDLEIMQNKDVIESAALLLRKTMLAMEKYKLNVNNIINIIDGNCTNVPRFLTDFYCLLLDNACKGIWAVLEIDRIV